MQVKSNYCTLSPIKVAYMYHSVKKKQYRTNKNLENCLMKNKITSGF